MLTLLAFIFVLGIAILFHEFGHFITAKLSGIKVFRFSIGFGPKIAGVFWKETEYTIGLFPFGGYVKMAGEVAQSVKEKNQEEFSADLLEESVPDEQRFDKKSFFVRASVIMNGPIMNIVLAILLLVIVFFFSGTAKVSNIVNEVNEGSPAEIAGIIKGDRIVAINSVKVEQGEEITELININKDKLISVSIERDPKSDTMVMYLTPEYNTEYERAMIGITLEVTVEKNTLFHSVRESFRMTGEILALIWKSFIEILTGRMPVELAGPLGIAQMAGEAAKIGFLNLLFFTAVINIFLGITNLFPIPILDGGQLVLLAFEKIRGKPIEPKHANFLYLIGFAIVVTIFIIATYQDILRIFNY